MKKGLVKLSASMPDCSQVVGDPTRKPVNKQAAMIVRPALEIFKPLPSDPDLTDRKTILKYLQERHDLMRDLHAAKTVADILRKREAKLMSSIHDLKSRIREMQETGKGIDAPVPDALAWDSQALTKFTDEELAAAIADTEKFRHEFVDDRRFTLSMDLLMRRILDQFRGELERRRTHNTQPPPCQ